MKIRALLVHGEGSPIAPVRSRLEACDDVQIVAEHTDVNDALEDLHALRPDLVFLDIDMPGGSGERLLDEVAAEPAVHAIVIARSPDHAARAFAANAVDYLLLPADDARIVSSIERARGILASRVRPFRRPRWTASRGADGYLRRLTVFADGRYHVVPIEQIDWIEAAANYAHAHANGRAYRIRETLKSLETKLHPDSFLRVHRSAIVRLDAIAAVESRPGGELELLLSSGIVLMASRSYARRVREWMKQAD